MLILRVCLVLFLAVALNGCGDTEVDSDVSPLDEDILFNIQPLEQPPELGSLIRPEDIPVVTIEITRQDDEHVWWRLVANPIPIHEDLVVSLGYYRLYVIPRNANTSAEVRTSVGSYGLIEIEPAEELLDDVFRSQQFYRRLPLILTKDGYAIQEDFQFTYYHVGTPSELTRTGDVIDVR